MSPWLEDGTNTYLRVQRNVCVGVGPTTATDALSLCTAPVASATRALVNLSNTALSGGSAAGTFIGANPAACTGDFFNFQVANVSKASLTCAGVLELLTAGSTNTQLYMTNNRTGSTSNLNDIIFQQNSDTAVKRLMGIIRIQPSDVTNASEDSIMYFQTMVAGTRDNRLTIWGNSIGINTITPPTGGGPSLAFGQGVNPTGIASNTAGIFSKDLAGTAEMYAFDEAGNFTLFSPHPTDFLDTLPVKDRPFPWAYRSDNMYLGKHIDVDFAGLVAAVERLSGETFAYVTDIPREDWAVAQDAQKKRTDATILARTIARQLLHTQINEATEPIRKAALEDELANTIIPEAYTHKKMPLWMQARMK